jgi:hypothetical protein
MGHSMHGWEPCVDRSPLQPACWNGFSYGPPEAPEAIRVACEVYRVGVLVTHPRSQYGSG